MRNALFCGMVALFSLIWSSAFIVGKIAVAEISPSMVLMLRFLVSSGLLLPVCLYHGRALQRNDVISTGFLLGLLNNALYLGLTFTALQYISAAWVVILTACSPFITAAFAAFFMVERIGPEKLLGLFVAFIGVVIMTGVTGLDGHSLLGLLMALGGTLSFCLGSVLFNSKGKDMPITTLNFWQSLSGAIILFPAALCSGDSLNGLSLGGMMAIGWLVIVSLAGMGLWFIIIRMKGAASAAGYHLLNPVSGLGLSYIILGADIHRQDGIGAACIAIGLLISIYGGVFIPKRRSIQPRNRQGRIGESGIFSLR